MLLTAMDLEPRENGCEWNICTFYQTINRLTWCRIGGKGHIMFAEENENTGF